jgi:hypothetical protein
MNRAGEQLPRLLDVLELDHRITIVKILQPDSRWGQTAGGGRDSGRTA